MKSFNSRHAYIKDQQTGEGGKGQGVRKKIHVFFHMSILDLAKMWDEIRRELFGQWKGDWCKEQKESHQNTLLYCIDDVSMKPCSSQWKYPSDNSVKHEHISGSLIFTSSMLVFIFSFRGTNFEKGHSSCWINTSTGMQEKTGLEAPIHPASYWNCFCAPYINHPFSLVAFALSSHGFPIIILTSCLHPTLDSLTLKMERVPIMKQEETVVTTPRPR